MSSSIYKTGFNKPATVSLRVFFCATTFFLCIGAAVVSPKRYSKITLMDAHCSHNTKRILRSKNMEHGGEHGQIRNASEALFKEMHAQDPQGFLIFNTRSLKAWLRSRAQQDDYLEGAMCAHRLSTEEVLTMWTGGTTAIARLCAITLATARTYWTSISSAKMEPPSAHSWPNTASRLIPSSTVTISAITTSTIYAMHQHTSPN